MQWTIIVPSELGIDKPNQVLPQCASTFISTIAWSKWFKSKTFAWKLPSIHSNTAHTLMKVPQPPWNQEASVRRLSHVVCQGAKRSVRVPARDRGTVLYSPITFLMVFSLTINCPAHHNNCNSFWIRLQFGKKYNVIYLTDWTQFYCSFEATSLLNNRH